MKIRTYNCYKANTKVEINPHEMIKRLLDRTESGIKYLMEIKQEIAKDYLEALKKRLFDAIGDFKINPSQWEFKELTKNLELLNEHPDLQELIIQFAWKHLALPKDYQLSLEKIEVTCLNREKASGRLSYHRVKAFVDVLGKDKGVQLYTKILARIVDEMNKKSKENLSVVKRREGAIKRWCKEGIADFTVAFDDDYKTLYRFDRCITHEALKDLNDPDIAYICSCFIGDIEEWNEGKVIHLRRTQTLHHGDFCDELYWDTRVHKDLEQPSLEFTRKLGRD